MSNLTPLPPKGPSGVSGASQQERVSNGQIGKVLAFVIVTLPTAVAVNVVLWQLAAWIGRQS